MCLRGCAHLLFTWCDSSIIFFYHILLCPCGTPCPCHQSLPNPCCSWLYRKYICRSCKCNFWNVLDRSWRRGNHGIIILSHPFTTHATTASVSWRACLRMCPRGRGHIFFFPWCDSSLLFLRVHVAHQSQWDHPCQIRATHGAADMFTILASVISWVVWIKVSRAINRIVILSLHPLATDITHF